MFNRLFDFVVSFWQDIRPWFVINEFERGIILRFGKFHRLVNPGLNWKIPFVDECNYDNVVPRTINLETQTLTTNDDKTVVVSAIVTIEINDIKKALLNVEGIDDASEDICYGVIGDVFTSMNWYDIIDSDSKVSETCAEQMSKEGEKYGVRIVNVDFADLACVRTYRLMR